MPGIYKVENFEVESTDGERFWLSTDATLEVTFTFEPIPLLGVSIDPDGTFALNELIFYLLRRG
jgi:hypothetical protein